MFHHSSGFRARKRWSSQGPVHVAHSDAPGWRGSGLCAVVQTACSLLAIGAACTVLLVLLILLMVHAPQFARRLAGLPTGDERLSSAVAADDLQQVRQALAEGACPRGTPSYRPLVIACHGDNRAILLALIEAGADVNAAHVGMTPLMAAAGRGRSDLVDLLLRAGADPDARGGYKSPIQIAAQRGHLHIVEQLLERGAALDTGPH